MHRKNFHQQGDISRSERRELGHGRRYCAIVRDGPVRVTPTEGSVANSIAKRKFISALGGAAVAWRSQRARMQQASWLIFWGSLAKNLFLKR
jgi:hypothetical protein